MEREVREVAVVVGAGPGLGEAVATRLAREGAAVALLARSADRLADIADRVSAAGAAGAAGVLPVAADVADEGSLEAALAEVARRLGAPTVLVHNPSVTVPGPATRTDPAALLSALRVSVGSLLVAARAVAPAMRAAGRGTMIVTGSRAALAGSTWSAAVGVQKAAVRSLAMSLAAELTGDGVHVTTVTIMGSLGEPGYEVTSIADAYAALVAATGAGPSTWYPEMVWESGRLMASPGR